MLNIDEQVSEQSASSRIPWTPFEEALLQAGCEKGLHWKVIAATFLSPRTENACEKKYSKIRSKTWTDAQLGAARLEVLRWSQDYSQTGSDQTGSEGSAFSSPASTYTTPSKPTIRQHGPLLLPKFRSQDFESPFKKTHKYASGRTANAYHHYNPWAKNSQTETFVPQHYVVPDSLPFLPPSPTTTLMSYLSSANPAPSLVHYLNTHVCDSNAKHFWWDIRQIRPWASFTLSAISLIPDLLTLLNLPLPLTNFPTPPPPQICHPETEAELHFIYSTFYITKLNAALAIAQGNRHLIMRPSTTPNQPSFISNYTDDTSELIYGRGFGRVVGLIKSFDYWNSGMCVEGNHKKVEYLRGLAHLHRCMREHGCRYGFIITEIEMVVVRNGTEGTPYFGYLEVHTIELAMHDSCAEVDDEGNMLEKEIGMTALLALFYLHMLARDVPFPGQVGWKTEIGAPAEGTRRKCLPKEEWIPEPQLVEMREAKRCRGWVWPEESVGRKERKELGRRGVRYGSL